MQVPLLDLKLQYQQIKAEVDAEIADIVESQYFILGPKVTRLEGEIAEYCGTQAAVGVSSGTDALLIALMAAGVGSGDRVLTTPYTFFATGGCISRLGARPVFVDIDPRTYNLSPEALTQVYARFSASERQAVKAVIPVHLYGQCAEMDSILTWARAHRVVVIEDAALVHRVDIRHGSKQKKKQLYELEQAVLNELLDELSLAALPIGDRNEHPNDAGSDHYGLRFSKVYRLLADD